MGNKQAQGRQTRDQLAKQMLDGYKKWMGMTNRKGSLPDAEAYFARIGFTTPQVKEIIGDVATSGTVAQPAAPAAPAAPVAPAREPTPAAPPPAANTPEGATEPQQAAAPEEPEVDHAEQAKFHEGKRRFHEQARDHYVDAANNETTNPVTKKKLMDKANEHHGNVVKHRDAAEQHQQAARQQAPMTADPRERLAASRVIPDLGNILAEAEPAVVEPPMGGSDMRELFTKAAAYAFDNQLVRSRIERMVNNPATVTGPVSGSNDQSGNQQSFHGGGNGGGNSGQATSNKADAGSPAGKMHKMWQQAGYDMDDLNDITNTAKKSSGISGFNGEDMRKLAFIGFAFLKSSR